MDVERLGMEIWEHSIKYEAIHQAAWNEISNFVNEVALIGQNFDLTL